MTTLLSLTEAAALIPGATADTLKRRARQGRLVVYRPGKAYCTTAADVYAMVKSCPGALKAPDCGSAPRGETPVDALPMPPHGLSSTAAASTALERQLANLEKLSAP